MLKVNDFLTVNAKKADESVFVFHIDACLVLADAAIHQRHVAVDVAPIQTSDLAAAALAAKVSVDVQFHIVTNTFQIR